MARPSRAAIVAVALLAALAAGLGLGILRDNGTGRRAAASAAPPVTLQTLPGKTAFDDATLRDGTVKLVNFWASWCVPCRVEHPNLTALADEGLAIYGVNYKDDPDKALGFLAELGDPYSGVGADPDGLMVRDWGVQGLPETLLIDGDGNIVTRQTGPITQRVIRESLRPALQALGAD